MSSAPARPLGVGSSTVFHMASNHQTAFHHSFRNESAYNPRLQTRVKCPSCGVWVRKGTQCKVCKETIAPPTSRAWTTKDTPRRVSSPERSAVTPRRTAESPPVASHGTSTTPRPTTPRSATPRNATPRSSHRPSYTNASGHSFRDTSSYAPTANSKLKCHGCGCWVTKGKACGVCKTVCRGL